MLPAGPERLLRARARRWKSGASPAGQVQNFPSQARESGPLEPQAGDEGRLLPSHLREAAKEVMDQRAHTIPALPSNSGASTVPAVTRCAPRSSRTCSPQPPQAPCELRGGPRRCALACVGRAVRAERRPRRSPACHICTYLKLGWWSEISGMPIADLASYGICID